MLFKFSFLLLYRDARPVADELVRAGQCIEQRSLTAIRVARKGDSDTHLTSSLYTMYWLVISNLIA